MHEKTRVEWHCGDEVEYIEICVVAKKKLGYGDTITSGPVPDEFRARFSHAITTMCTCDEFTMYPLTIYDNTTFIARDDKEVPFDATDLMSKCLQSQFADLTIEQIEYLVRTTEQLGEAWRRTLVDLYAKRISEDDCCPNEEQAYREAASFDIFF